MRYSAQQASIYSNKATTSNLSVLPLSQSSNMRVKADRINGYSLFVHVANDSHFESEIPSHSSHLKLHSIDVFGPVMCRRRT